MSNKVMPYSIEAEESLLGNIILYADAMRQTVDAAMTADDFYLEKHQIIYKMMMAMYENKEKVELNAAEKEWASAMGFTEAEWEKIKKEGE